MKRTLSLLVARHCYSLVRCSPFGCCSSAGWGGSPACFQSEQRCSGVPRGGSGCRCPSGKCCACPGAGQGAECHRWDLGILHSCRGEDGYYPWAAEEGYAKSTNQGVDSWYVDSTYTIPSASVVNTTVETEEGEILYFRYRDLAASRQIGCAST